MLKYVVHALILSKKEAHSRAWAMCKQNGRLFFFSFSLFSYSCVSGVYIHCILFFLLYFTLSLYTKWIIAVI